MTERQKDSIIESREKCPRTRNSQKIIYSLSQILEDSSNTGNTDIEYTNTLSGQKKHRQYIVRPNKSGFKGMVFFLRNVRKMVRMKNLCGLYLSPNNWIINIMFIFTEKLPNNYQIIQLHYPAYCNIKFWKYGIGERDFYNRWGKISSKSYAYL